MHIQIPYSLCFVVSLAQSYLTCMFSAANTTGDTTEVYLELLTVPV